MVAFFCPPPFMRGSAASATRVFVTTATSSANANSYTFNGTDIGPAASDRLLVVVVSAIVGSATTSGLTVNEAAATSVRSQQGGSFANTHIFSHAVPTGTTADFVVSATGSVACRIAVYSLYNLVSLTAFSSAGRGSAGAVALDVPDTGIIIGGACSNLSGTYSWTNAAKDYDAVISDSSDRSSSYASDEGLNAQTGRSISCSTTAGGSFSMAVASWG